MNNNIQNKDLLKHLANMAQQVNSVVEQTKKLINCAQSGEHFYKIDVDLLRKRVIDLYDMVDKTESLSNTMAFVIDKPDENEPVKNADRVFVPTITPDNNVESEVECSPVKEFFQQISDKDFTENSEFQNQELEHDVLNVDDHESSQIISDYTANDISDIMGRKIEKPTFVNMPQPTIADKLAENNNFTIADKLNEDDKHRLHSNVEKPLKDLKSALDLNDKFMLTKELFDGNSDKFNKAIATLNNFKNRGEATFYLESLRKELNWDAKSEPFLKLYSLVCKKIY